MEFPRWRVRVPASTSNLGPGFDLLGLCLGLGLEVDLERVEGEDPPALVTLEGEAAHWPREGNRLLQGLAAGLAGSAPQGSLRLHVRSEIPVGRGFGSTGAACAAGLLLGRALRDGDLEQTGERLELVAAGSAIEGHPDNVTASLLGGLTLALRPNGDACAPAPEDRWTVLRPTVHPELALAVAWGTTPLDTPTARAALPAQVPFAAAADQPRRLVALLEGLRRADPELLALGGVDHLHEAARLPLVRGGVAALAAAREAGAWFATLSGAGSGLVALGPREVLAEVALAMAEVLEEADGPAHGKVLEVVREAPSVEALVPRSSGT